MCHFVIKTKIKATMQSLRTWLTDIINFLGYSISTVHCVANAYTILEEAEVSFNTTENLPQGEFT